MTDIEKIRDWVKSFGGVPDNFRIDYTNEVSGNAGLYPEGIVEVRRASDILGNVTVTNQMNFGLYIVLENEESTDIQAARNAEWVMNFQKWVQEQSARRLAPTFGNTDTRNEIIRAQNGQLYGEKDDGISVYMVVLSVQFKYYYGRGE